MNKVAIEYLDREIKPHLVEAITALMYEKPEDQLGFLVEWFLSGKTDPGYPKSEMLDSREDKVNESLQSECERTLPTESPSVEHSDFLREIPGLDSSVETVIRESLVNFECSSSQAQLEHVVARLDAAADQTVPVEARPSQLPECVDTLVA